MHDKSDVLLLYRRQAVCERDVGTSVCGAKHFWGLSAFCVPLLLYTQGEREGRVFQTALSHSVELGKVRKGVLKNFLDARAARCVRVVFIFDVATATCGGVSELPSRRPRDANLPSTVRQPLSIARKA